MMFMSLSSNTTGVTCGAGVAYSSGPHEFTPSIQWIFLLLLVSSSFSSFIHLNPAFTQKTGDGYWVPLYGVNFAAVTCSMSRCEMTSLRSICLLLVAFKCYSYFHFYLNPVVMR